MSESYDLRFLSPAAELGSECAPCAFRLRAPGGREFFFALSPRSSSAEPGGAEAASILSDLFRPGWEPRARLITTPILRDGRLYRGFCLARSTTYGGSDWDVECLIPADLSDDFDWPGAAASLAAFHRLIHGNRPHD